MTCEKCGKCCNFKNGAPFIYPEDIEKWIKHKQWAIVSRVKFTIQTVDGVNPIDGPDGQQYTFQEKAGGECIFKFDTECCIYYSRPLSCRAFINCLSGNDIEYNVKELKAHAKARKRFTEKWSIKRRQEYLIAVLKRARKHDDFRPDKGFIEY